MAKKKTETEIISPDETAAQRIIRSLTKTYGTGAIVPSDKLFEKPRIIIPTSPAVDSLIGGVPEGSWMSIFGPEKTGKTSQALRLAANCQKPEYGGRHVYYVPAESRVKEMNIYNTHDLSLAKLTIIPDVYNKERTRTYTSQEILDMCYTVIMDDPGCCLIIDSVSALSDENELTSSIGVQDRGASNKWIAQFVRKICQAVSFKRAIVVLMSHVIADTSGTGMGSGRREKTASALLYQADVKIKAEWKEFYPKTGKPTGQYIHWKSITTALPGYIPNQKRVGFLRYGYGIDDIQENIELAVSYGIIDKKEKDPWYRFGDMKGQGIDNFREEIVNHPELYTQIKKELKEYLV